MSRRGLLASVCLGLGAAAWLPLTGLGMSIAMTVHRVRDVLLLRDIDPSTIPLAAFYYWRDYGDDPSVAHWLPICAGIAATVALVPVAMCLGQQRRMPSLRGWGGLQPVVRGTSDNHGHADWLPMREARRRFPGPEGVVIGEARRADERGPAPLLVDPCKEGSTHSLIFSGSGGFKTSGAVTRLLHWTGSAVVLDPSAEIGPMTHRARAAMGQAIHEIAPSGEGFDVLAGIDPASPRATQRVLSAVASICGEEPERGENAVFSDAGRNLVACILADMIWEDSAPPEGKTLWTFRELITTPEIEMKRRLEVIAQTSKSSLARFNARTLMGLEPETFSGAYFNSSQFVSWLFDDAVAQFVSTGILAAADVVWKPTTVFVQVPLSTLATTPAVARVVLDALTWTFIEADGAQVQAGIPRALLLADEASALGKMRSLEMVRDRGRKYGLTLHMLFLSPADINKAYGRDGFKEWVPGMSWVGYGPVGVIQDAEDLSRAIGTHAALASSEGDNTGSSGKSLGDSSRSRGRNTSTHEIKRPVIFPHELMEAAPDELFVLGKGGLKMRCAAAPYFRRPELADLVDSNRFVKQAAE